MAVTAQGLTLYRPTASVQREYSYDSDGETIGVTDSVTINDTVLSQDAALIEKADGIIGYAKEGSTSFRSLTYGGNTGQGRVTSLAFDSSSDYTNVLKYSITFRVVPTNASLISSWGFTPADGVTDLSYRESFDRVEDINLISLQSGGDYWNNHHTYTFEASVSCQQVDANTKTQDLAKAALNQIKAIVPTRITKVVNTQGTNNYLSISETSSKEGTASINITVAIVPDGSSSGTTIISSEEQGVEKINTPQEYEKLTYKVTFKTLENMTIDAGGGISSESTRGAAESLAQEVVSYYNGNVTPSSTPPGKTIVCQTELPKLPAGSCFNVTSAGIDVDHAGKTATAVIESSTEPQNCDGDGYKVEHRTNHIKNKKLHAELFGWGVSKSIVQDLQSKSADVKEYNVQVSSVSKCLTSQLKAKAESKFNEIKDGSGTITKHNIVISNGRCTITATEFLGQPDDLSA